MTDPRTLRKQYHEVREKINLARARRGDPGPEVVLVAVTSNAEPEDIRCLLEMGHVDFGEHRVQNLQQRVAMVEEFLERHRTLTPSRKVNVPSAVRWHMIGPVKRNKLRLMLRQVKLTHTISNLRIAEDIQNAAIQNDEQVDVLLQVNATRNKKLPGLTVPAALHVAELIDTMIHLQLRGVTATPPPADCDLETARLIYQRCRETFEEIKTTGIGGSKFNMLCMGNSRDYETAIETGANVVCLEQAIFGEKNAAAPDKAKTQPA